MQSGTVCIGGRRDAAGRRVLLQVLQELKLGGVDAAGEWDKRRKPDVSCVWVGRREGSGDFSWLKSPLLSARHPSGMCARHENRLDQMDAANGSIGIDTAMAISLCLAQRHRDESLVVTQSAQYVRIRYSPGTRCSDSGCG